MISVEQAYNTHADELYRYLNTLLPNPEEAADVLHATFLKFIRLVQGGLAVDNVRVYLFRAVRNEALKSLERRHRPPPRIVLEPADPSASQSDAEQLGRALALLPQEQREVVVLQAYEQLTFREIAEILGESPNTVAHRYQYGLQKLRAMMGEPDRGD